MPWVSSANIACGGHAGDEDTMRETIALARRRGVAVGAHPGYEDREHFGRRELQLEPEQVGQLVAGQVRALARVAAAAGVQLSHVKPHGALYNQAARDGALARAVARAIRSVDASLLYYGLAGSEGLRIAREEGLRIVEEVFADRTYRNDGSLTPRSEIGALVETEEAAVVQVLAMVREGRVRTREGLWVRVRADTVCLHGDGAHAVAFARRLRTMLEAAGVAVRAPETTGTAETTKAEGRA